MYLLTISVKNTRPEVVKFERKVIETWLQAQMKCLGPQMCFLTISVKNPDRKLSNWPKIAVFIEKIFKIYKNPYPFEFGGGLGLIMFHKNFLVTLHFSFLEKVTWHESVTDITWEAPKQRGSVSTSRQARRIQELVPRNRWLWPNRYHTRQPTEQASRPCKTEYNTNEGNHYGVIWDRSIYVSCPNNKLLRTRC